MMHLNGYLNFQGDCEPAFKFYEQSLGAKIVMLVMHRDSPVQGEMPADWLDKVMHARLALPGGGILMGSDVSPACGGQAMGGFSLSLNCDEAAEAERVYEALSAGGSIRMPLEETFWAERFGMFTDRFGVPWLVNCEKKTGA